MFLVDRMSVFCHTAFAQSYDTQFIGAMNEYDLDVLLKALDEPAQNVFGNRTITVADTLKKETWLFFAVHVCNHLDGVLTRLTAEQCRIAYRLMKKYHNEDEIHDLQVIYNHLHQHFKKTRNPMPLRRS